MRLVLPRRRTAMAVALVVCGWAGSACGRTAEEQAAVRAQDACIVALEPVAEDRRPSPEALRSATRSAEAAARADARWEPLRSRVSDFTATMAEEGGAKDGRAALDALVKECGRVNQIVKDRRDDV